MCQDAAETLAFLIILLFLQQTLIKFDPEPGSLHAGSRGSEGSLPQGSYFQGILCCSSNCSLGQSSLLNPSTDRCYLHYSKSSTCLLPSGSAPSFEEKDLRGVLSPPLPGPHPVLWGRERLLSRSLLREALGCMIVPLLPCHLFLFSRGLV